MPDDDPIEDLQRAGATAGAAGARAVEAALRSRQQQTQQQAQQQEREATRRAQRPLGSHESGFGRQVGGYAEDDPSRRLSDDDYRPARTVSLDDPDTWGSRDDAVTEAQQWTLKKAGAEIPATKGEASKVIRDLYDTPDARAARHDAMEAAGVPLEPRQAAMAADKMNAQDPALAAASGSRRQTQHRRAPRTAQRERGR